MPLRVIIGCEESATVRDAFRALGHDAWSCDTKPSRGDPCWHHQCDLFALLTREPDWDFGIFHPTCTYLANSGSKHLYRGMRKAGGINPGRWAAMLNGAGFFRALLSLPFPFAIENPVMHRHARREIGVPWTQTVQPWQFGDPFFKATCLWLQGVPPLVEGPESLRAIVPKPGTDEHKAWSRVHREAPGPDRQQKRSETFPGLARAMAQQWSEALTSQPELRMAA